MAVWQPTAFRMYAPVTPNHISIEERRQTDGSSKWTITDGFNMVLNKDGAWEREPIPSSRDEDFMGRTRFASWQDAMNFFETWESRE